MGQFAPRIFTASFGDAGALKDDFKAAQKEGKAAYAENKGNIEALAGQRDKLEQLSNDLKDGKLSLEAYEKAVAELT